MKKAGLYLMAAFYFVAGLNHFLSPLVYLRLIPPYLPCHEALNWISGGVEILFALMLLARKSRPWAAWGIVALLIAIFPVHVYMYQARGTEFKDIPEFLLLLRMPLQVLLMYWAYVYT